jgi:hypothetical protein
MPVSDPFIYLLIVAAVFPVLWVAWWAADCAFRGSQVVKAAVPIPTAAKRPRSDYPRPVDLTLPRRRGTLIIYSRSQLTEIGGCLGADAAGKCPRAVADGTVACAGSLLSLPAPIRGSGEWQVPFGYKVCPVASYDIYRRAASPN